MRRSKRHNQLAEINVVPYIDVMLVLLTIFMVTTPILFQGVNVDLPTASAKATDSKPQESIVLSIDAKGDYYLNISKTPTSPISAKNINTIVTSELKKSDKIKRTVSIKADKKLRYFKVVKAISLLKEAGAPNIGLIMQPD